jgi:hypothetical protein
MTAQEQDPVPDDQSDAAAAHKGEWRIFVNTKEKQVGERELSFEQIVELAQPLPSGPNYEYTIDYRRAAKKEKGELMPGESVEIKNGTIFDVTATDKS